TFSKFFGGNAVHRKCGLYSQTKDFLVGVGASRLSSTGVDQDLYQTEINFQWKAKTGTGRFQTQLMFYSPQTPKKAGIPVSIPDSDVEKEICRSFYQESSKSLTQLLSENGGNRDTIMSLGKILVFCNAFLDSEVLFKLNESIGKWRAELKPMPADRYDANRFQLVSALASGSYEIARTAFQFLHTLTPEVRASLSAFDQGHLGSTLWDNADRPRVGYLQIDKVYQLFLFNLLAAKNNYEILLEDGMEPFQDRKRQFQTLLKLLDVYKILVFLPNSPVTAAQREKFLAFVGSQFEDRNPYLARFVQQEIELSKKPQLMLEKSPSLGQIVGSVSWKPNLDSFLQSGTPTN
ncbi:MAG TPA: hypothetical protein PKM25_03570, partial [Candidatus Ozemobacteraceae bacterium]|nr:hypothetical protein [Candidatus Ozemobacteraceae bacterium]